MSSQYATYPSLRDKIVVITGGAEGIGAACVELFYQQGSRVAFLDISHSSAETLIARLPSTTINTIPLHAPIFYSCDVTSIPTLQSTARTILSTFSTVHILINNAASAGLAARTPTLSVTPETWDFDMAVNLRHAFFLSQAFLPTMQAQKSGSIINMGSISWRIAAAGLPAYTTSKAAIVGLTRSLAREFGGDGVRINSVMPGAIATERQKQEVLTEGYREEVWRQQALKRDLLPDEVARVVLFLASEDAGAVTGSSYVVDGGWVSDP